MWTFLFPECSLNYIEPIKTRKQRSTTFVEVKLCPVPLSRLRKEFESISKMHLVNKRSLIIQLELSDL